MADIDGDKEFTPPPQVTKAVEAAKPVVQQVAEKVGATAGAVTGLIEAAGGVAGLAGKAQGAVAEKVNQVRAGVDKAMESPELLQDLREGVERVKAEVASSPAGRFVSETKAGVQAEARRWQQEVTPETMKESLGQAGRETVKMAQEAVKKVTAANVAQAAHQGFSQARRGAAGLWGVVSGETARKKKEEEETRKMRAEQDAEMERRRVAAAELAVKREKASQQITTLLVGHQYNSLFQQMRNDSVFGEVADGLIRKTAGGAEVAAGYELFRKHYWAASQLATARNTGLMWIEDHIKKEEQTRADYQKWLEAHPEVKPAEESGGKTVT